MTYDASMAAGYDAGRRLRTVDVDRWMTVARPYLPRAGGRILDLGAGTGRFSAALAQTCGATVVACEPSPAMRTAWSVHHPRVAWWRGRPRPRIRIGMFVVIRRCCRTAWRPPHCRTGQRARSDDRRRRWSWSA
jgi:SAM-dependent methyltransferase